MLSDCWEIKRRFAAFGIMEKTATLNLRVNPAVKERAEEMV